MSFSEGNILKPFGESSNKQASVFNLNINSGYMINCDVFQFFREFQSSHLNISNIYFPFLLDIPCFSCTLWARVFNIKRGCFGRDSYSYSGI